MSTLSHEPPVRSRLVLFGTVLLVGSAVVLSVFMLRSLDVKRVGSLIAAIGWTAALIYTPYLVLQMSDVVAWRQILGRLGQPLSLRVVWMVRASTDSMFFSAPGGVVVADGLKAALFKQRQGVPLSLTFASLAMRKSFIFLSHGVAILLGLWLGASLYGRLDALAFGEGVISVVAVVVASGLVSAGLFIPFLLARGQLAGRLHRRLTRLTPGAIGRWLTREHAQFQRLDRHCKRFQSVSASRRLFMTTCYLMTWLMEALEAFVILRLLGVEVGFEEALVIETSAAVIRAGAFFVPAGIGFQDLGYAVFMYALGVPNALEMGAAFSLLKRSREALWVVIGYSMLASLRRLWPEEGDAASALASAAEEAER